MTTEARRRTVFRQVALWAILVSAALTVLKVTAQSPARFGVWLPHIPLLVLGIALLRSPPAGPRPVVFPLPHAARSAALVAVGTLAILFLVPRPLLPWVRISVAAMFGLAAGGLSLLESRARRVGASELRLVGWALAGAAGLLVFGVLQIFYVGEMIELGPGLQALGNALDAGLGFLGSPRRFLALAGPLAAVAPAFLIARRRGLDLPGAWAAQACVSQALAGISVAVLGRSVAVDSLAMAAVGFVIVPAFWLADRWTADPEPFSDGGPPSS